MTEIAVWFLMCCATTYLITEASLFTSLRTFVASFHIGLFTLLYCRKCIGFWVGITSGLIGIYPLVPIEPSNRPFEAGMVFMALMWVLDGSAIPERDVTADMTLVDMWRSKREKEKWFT